MDNSSIIMRIEIRLKELGKTKAEFYKGAGITSATYSQWNTNMFSPSKRKLQGVAKYLGVSVDYLLGEETEKAPTATGERDILDEVDIGFYNGFKELTEAQKEAVRRMVQVMREQDKSNQED